ncbi:MAG: hypothetical protein JXA04_01805 [Gammaproteobacteria bacterium]|nr:hypothetical protein [Gammaproteobacteria bacterium]
MVNRISTMIAWILLAAILYACDEKESTKTVAVVAPPVVEKKETIPIEHQADQIRNEMEALRQQREEAQQEKARLEQQVEKIQASLDDVEGEAERIQTRINELEKPSNP